MTSNDDQAARPTSDRPGLAKDPEEWVSGDDPMTDAQAAYLETLSRQTGEEIPEGLTKAAASEKIDELRAKAGLEEHGVTGDAAGGSRGDEEGPRGGPSAA